LAQPIQMNSQNHAEEDPQGVGPLTSEQLLRVIHDALGVLAEDDDDDMDEDAYDYELSSYPPYNPAPST